MRALTKALRVVAVVAAVGAGTLVVTEAPAFASGCSGAYTDSGRGYRGGPCTGYPSTFHLHAAATCKPQGSGSSYNANGPRAVIGGTSKVLCQSGYYASNGHTVVENN
ncbi:hypothetical protein [Dactylosporangium sp. NPDC051541]|uniref:hypothetical protein n=1 Tax=Dactylosporangium sp. NPDC051541 TaxID=3363977 RepID=UPI00378B8DDB